MKVIMSIYLINKILYLTDNDPEFRKRIKADPEGTVRNFPLNEAELKALTSGDVGALYQMGVHTFMLNHLSRYELFGGAAVLLTGPHGPSLRGAMGRETASSTFSQWLLRHGRGRSISGLDR